MVLPQLHYNFLCMFFSMQDNALLTAFINEQNDFTILIQLMYSYYASSLYTLTQRSYSRPGHLLH